MDNVTKLLLQGAAGGAGGAGEFIDNLFETRLWDGTSGSRTITNGIDLSGEGGLVWIKRRTGSSENSGLFDTVRGAGKWVVSNAQNLEDIDMNRVSAFNNNGFSLGSDNMVNNSGHSYLGYTFRKQKKFFDIVTYTGTGTARTVAHNLGSVPGVVLIKNLGLAQNWVMYHRSIANTKALLLDDAGGTTTSQGYWNNTSPTASNFTVGNDGMMNGNGYNYVAYIFAHDEAVFGLEGNTSVIKCGNYTGNGSSNGPDVNLGWEPQWLLIKRSNSSEDWMLFDHMRTSRRADMYLDDYRPNKNSGDGDGAGGDSQPYLNWTSTGFKLSSNTGHTNGSGDNYIYIAIRRPDGAVGKPITNPTDAFDIKLMETNGTEPFYKTQNTVDMGIGKRYDTSGGATDWFVTSRFQDSYYLDTHNNYARQSNSYQTMDYQQGWNSYTGSWGDNIGFAWKRHAGFDVVSYKGSGSAGHQVYHNLNQVPEMIWVKCLTQAESWIVYHKGLNGGTNPHNYYLQLNSNGVGGAWNWMNGVAPTETTFTLGSGASINFQLQYMAYLFASVEGISKCGYYTGSGAAGNAQNIGFQPRLVLIKNITDNGNGWMLINSVHGFSKYQFLNSSDPFVSGTYISPSATGFSFTGGPGISNESAKNYIYYAHA